MCFLKIRVRSSRRPMHVTDAMIVYMLIVSGMEKIRKALGLVIFVINTVYVLI